MSLADAEALARQLILQWLTPKWKFAWEESIYYGGHCNKRKRLITLSGPFTLKNSEEHVRLVILHEIAHGLCRSRISHGRHFYAWCRRIGAEPKRCYLRGCKPTREDKLAYKTEKATTDK